MCFDTRFIVGIHYFQNVLLGIIEMMMVGCDMCTGLGIKMDPGDDTNCSTECTGISDIPNTNHTACSKLC